MTDAPWKNKLYYGDNLEIMRGFISDETVDLIYLDPPFNSKATYNVLFGEANGTASAAQIAAFEDTWHWDIGSEMAYAELVRDGPEKLSDLIQALRKFLGTNDMMAYLTMMAVRLVEMRRVLKPTGSIYLHCDPTASHYLKLLMDAVFGHNRFMNEVVWKRTTAHSGSRKYGPVHDTIFYYSNGPTPIWNEPRLDYELEYLEKYYKFDDGDGRLFWRDNLCAAGIRHGRSGLPWRGIDPTEKGMHWKFTIDRLDELDAEGRIYWPPKGSMPQYKRYRDELKGRLASDIWDDLNRINPVGRERLGYPTQKPEALLERIISASSNPSDLVLDPFCGCGTTVNVAERLGRRWIGIDITNLAISLMISRLKDTFGSELSPFEVHGVPKDLSGAKALAAQDPYQFQWWALGQVGARPAQDKKKGADKGIDGWISYFDDNSGQAKRIVLQVKSGHVKSGDVRDLKGVMSREGAEIGVFITLEPPTKDMTTEAAAAGIYQPEMLPGQKYPRLQVLTVEDILAGAQVDYPRAIDAWRKQAPGTFKRAKRQGKEQQSKQKPMV